MDAILKTKKLNYPLFLLILANIPLIVFLVFLDEGNYNLGEYQHIYTWFFTLFVSCLFALIGWGNYRFLKKFWVENNSRTIQLVLAYLFEIPVINILIMVISFVFRLVRLLLF